MKSDKIQYSLFKERNLEKRYLPPTLLKSIIETRNYEFTILGKSYENRDIHLMSLGNGKKEVLLWSQMHGNESSATRAMLDIWNFLHSTHSLAQKIKEEITIDYIPQLNPDGAEYYTRRNAINIDLNRDFLHNQSTELPILKAQASKKDYKFLFNLHDQRSIFHPKGKKHPATLSFLSPSMNQERDLTDSRVDAMKLIMSMYNELSPILSDGIARFTDEFYPKATGDNFQKLNFPTILIECGHFPNDYDREKTREYTFYAILSALKAIAEDSWQDNNHIDYQNIPENSNKAFDFIYRNVKIKNQFNESVTDIGILYQEILNNNSIEFRAVIAEIGDLSDSFGHVDIDTSKQVFNGLESDLPKLNSPANFKIGDLLIENGKIVNR